MDTMSAQTITLSGRRYAILEARECNRLRALARAAEEERIGEAADLRRV
jgi:hypothetical protein